jgi:hypothetical protein
MSNYKGTPGQTTSENGSNPNGHEPGFGESSDLFLLPQHQKLIDESMITPEVAKARRYRTILRSEELLDLGFSDQQSRLTPCLYNPIFNVRKDIVGHSIRPDHPRKNDQGKEAKYERTPNSRNCLDFNPLTPAEWVVDIRHPFMITESSRKVDSVISDGMLCAGLSGVWNWVFRDKSLNGSSLIIPDFRDIPLKERRTLLAFDNDSISKEPVYQALVELGEYLKHSYGADVGYIHIELDGFNDRKMGVDDFRFFGGDLMNLVNAAQDEPREPENLKKFQNKDDFVAFPETNKFIFLPTGKLWLPEGVNSQVKPVPIPGGTTRPTEWISHRRNVQQMTWAPGESPIIEDKILDAGGWIRKEGVRAYNDYRAPIRGNGDPSLAGPYLDHVRRLYPENAGHILAWLAHRVQRPEEKVNHALVLGGEPGIGKDTILAPVKYAVGPSNVANISPTDIGKPFNSWARNVMVVISEARDLGESTKYTHYEHMKIFLASPPETILVNEKHVPEYPVLNVAGFVYTSNYRNDALYLTENDRRHYVAWSEAKTGDFPPEYFTQMYRWFENGGNDHVTAYLEQYDLSDFNPKAPPPKTDAFWMLAHSARTPEDALLADALEELGNPDAVTIPQIKVHLNKNRTRAEELLGWDLAEWFGNPKNGRQIPHRMEAAGYLRVDSRAKDGVWKVNKKRTTVYSRKELSPNERFQAADALTREASESNKESRS